MTDTLQKASDLVQEAARHGRIGVYLEADPEGEFKLIMPEGEYAMYSELLYRAADKCAEHAALHLPPIHLRD